MSVRRLDLRGRTDFTRSRRCCRTCHQSATHQEITATTALTVARDGTMTRDPSTEVLFYCAAHTGIAA